MAMVPQGRQHRVLGDPMHGYEVFQGSSYCLIRKTLLRLHVPNLGHLRVQEYTFTYLHITDSSELNSSGRTLYRIYSRGLDEYGRMTDYSTDDSYYDRSFGCQTDA